MRTPIGALGIRPEQYFDPMLTALRYIDRAVRTSGLPIGSVLPMTGVLGPRAMIEAPGEQVEAFKACLEPAMRGDWDAAIAAYQDEITPTLPWQDPGSKIPGYWGAMEIPAAFVPTGGPYAAGARIASKAPTIARSAAKLAPAAARPAVYRGVRKTAEPVGKAMMAPWQLENLALRGAVKGVKGVGRGAGWLGGRARRGAAETAVRVPGGEELGLKIAGVKPVAGGANGAPLEPWQMTKDNFVREYEELYSRTRAAEKTPAEGKPVSDELLREYEEKGDWEAFSRARGYTEKEIDDFRRSLQLLTDKFPEEYARTSDIHREHLVKALAEGKPIPDEVLREYPDLQFPGMTRSSVAVSYTHLTLPTILRV